MKKIAMLIVLLLISGAVFADDFNVNGYEISVRASRSGETVKVSGRLRGGVHCKKLRLDIFLHDELGHRASVISTLQNVGGYGSRLIQGSDTLIKPEGNNWEVSSVFASCISDKGY